MKRVLLLAAFFMVASSFDTGACSRLVYKGKDGVVVTARSMDWQSGMPTDLWILPRGMKHQGGPEGKSLDWVSKYGSVIASTWGLGASDGMNEKGLMMNMLWLSESVYPEADGRPELTIAAWGQYVLDNFASVSEAVAELSKERFRLFTLTIPGQERPTNLHLSLSDGTGDSAILEYIDGHLTIHHGPEYQVMTNSPKYDDQLAINGFIQKTDGQKTLPGSCGSSDRFARAWYYVNHIPQTDDSALAVRYALSVIRNCSTPLGVVPVENAPNLSATQWRVLADHKNLTYYFESAYTPNLISIDLRNVDFLPSSGMRRLSLSHGESYVGNVNAKFTLATGLLYPTSQIF